MGAVEFTKKHINKHRFSYLVLHLLIPLGFGNRRQMNYGQPPRDTLHHPNGQQLAEDDTISATYPTGFYTRLVYEQSVQGQTPSPSSTNYPPDNSPPATEWDLGISILGIGEDRRVSHSKGGSILQPLPHVDVSCLRDLHCLTPLHRRLVFTHTIPQSRHTIRVLCPATFRKFAAISPTRLATEPAAARDHLTSYHQREQADTL